MKTKGMVSASQNMEEQAMRNDAYGFSLDAMWRAVGSPDGQSPAEWLETAKKLVEGIADYRSRVHALYPRSDEWDFADDPVVVWKVTLEDIQKEVELHRERGIEWEYDPFCRDGDTMAMVEIADYYCRHLDAEDIHPILDAYDEDNDD